MLRMVGAGMASFLFIAGLSAFDLPADNPDGRLPVSPAVLEAAGGSAKGKVNWITLEEAYERVQLQPRKILIDLYTDWCGWCKVMDRETYTNVNVAEYINKNYYPVKFNAEQRQSVRFANRNFVFVPRGKSGVHQLALVLTNNKPSYPTTVFMNEDLKVIQPLPGFMKAKEFYEVVTFFGGDHYKNESFENYKEGTFGKLY